MRKRLLTILLAFTTIFVFTACTTSNEDPENQKGTVDVVDNGALNDFINQYNMDAVNPIGNDDIVDVTSTSVEFNINDLRIRVTTPDEKITTLIEFTDKDDADLQQVSTDLIVTMDPNVTYDDIDQMLVDYRENGKTSFTINELDCSFDEGDGGIYQLRVVQ